MKKSPATVTIKIEHFEKALSSPKFHALKCGILSVEKAKEHGVSWVDSIPELMDLNELINLLLQLESSNLNLIDSVTIPIEQFKYLEVFQL